MTNNGTRASDGRPDDPHNGQCPVGDVAKKYPNEPIQRYRKRPLEIDATQWFKMGDHPEVKLGIWDISEATGGWVFHKPCRDDVGFGFDRMIPGERLPYVDTLEGVMMVSEGDWIIRGVAGEIYPCKPEIFEKTYCPANKPSTDEASLRRQFRPVIARLMHRDDHRVITAAVDDLVTITRTFLGEREGKSG